MLSGFLTQHELPRAFWCLVASPSASLMTARHPMHAEPDQSSAYGTVGGCCCSTTCLRFQLQEVQELTETGKTLKMYITPCNSTATRQCAMSKGAMQDCDEQNCRWHPLCQVAQVVCSHEFDALIQLLLVNLNDITLVSSRFVSVYKVLGPFRAKTCLACSPIVSTCSDPMSMSMVRLHVCRAFSC